MNNTNENLKEEMFLRMAKALYVNDNATVLAILNESPADLLQAFINVGGSMRAVAERWSLKNKISITNSWGTGFLE